MQNLCPSEYLLVLKNAINSLCSYEKYAIPFSDWFNSSIFFFTAILSIGSFNRIIDTNNKGYETVCISACQNNLSFSSSPETHKRLRTEQLPSISPITPSLSTFQAPNSLSSLLSILIASKYPNTQYSPNGPELLLPPSRYRLFFNCILRITNVIAPFYVINS